MSRKTVFCPYCKEKMRGDKKAGPCAGYDILRIRSCDCGFIRAEKWTVNIVECYKDKIIEKDALPA